MNVNSILVRPRCDVSRKLENIKLCGMRSQGLHPSEILLSGITSRSSLPELPNSTQFITRPTSIAYNSDLQDLYDATTEFLSDREHGECRCLDGDTCPFGLPSEQLFGACTFGSPSREGMEGLSMSETLDEYISEDVLFSVGSDADSNVDEDAVQEIGNLALLHVEESSRETSPLGAYFDNVTMQMTRYTALETLKEPSPAGPHLGAYYDGERRRMASYTALDEVCNFDEVEVCSAYSPETIGNSLVSVFFQFPKPVFSDNNQVGSEQEMTSEEVVGIERMLEIDTKLRIRSESPSNLGPHTGVDEPIKPQSQIEYDGVPDKLVYARDYELDHHSGRPKPRNRASSLCVMIPPTINEEDEPNSVGSVSCANTLADYFSDPCGAKSGDKPPVFAASMPAIEPINYCSCMKPCKVQCLVSYHPHNEQLTREFIEELFSDDVWCNTPNTELHLPCSPICVEDLRLPGQILPTSELLGEFSTEVDGLLSTILEQLNAGLWDGLPTLGCDIHSALHALSDEYPVLGVMERLGAAIETLVESVAALESIRADLLGNEGSA